MTTVVPLDLPPGPLAADLARGLAAVEDILDEQIQSSDELVTEASRHLVQAGGKRFRATLVLLAAHLGDPDDERIIPAAAVIELTHLATLYHDDVMDEAGMRRGRPSVNSRWGNTIAILTGDYLFARASELLADLGPEAIRIQARTFGRLVQGQIRETAGPAPGEDPLAHYLGVVADKTGSLIATSGRFGAMFSGCDPQTVRRVTAACEAIGIAFQLSDDILDIASEVGQSGKTPGTDLREGIRTLPVLHALRAAAGPGDPADPGHRATVRLAELLSSDLTDPALLDEALTLLRGHPAMEAARADMRRWVAAGRDELAALAPGEARAAFESLCDFVIARTG